MKCVICKTGDVEPGTIETDIKVGTDRLVVRMSAERCPQCGEAYYSAEDLRKFERLREDFVRKAITPQPVGRVYEVS